MRSESTMKVLKKAKDCTFNAQRYSQISVHVEKHECTNIGINIGCKNLLFSLFFFLRNRIAALLDP